MIQYLTNLLNILLSILPNISRVSPHIYAFIIVLYVIFNNSIISLYLLVSFYMMFASNYIFKFIFRMLYDFIGVKSLPLLGIGVRPDGAKNCSICWNNSVPQKCLGYGMPSGHSQITWAFSSYLVIILLVSIVNFINTNNQNKLVNESNKLFNESNKLFNENNKLFNENSKLDNLKYFGIYPIIIIVLIIHSLYISYSRVYIENCHTIQQVVVGGLIGVSISIIVFIVQGYLFKK